MVKQSSQTPADVMKRVESAQPAAQAQQLGWSAIAVPSRGVLYEGRLPGGFVQMRKMMSSEMARLQGQGGSVLEKIEAMVNACTKLPEGFNAKEFLLTDSFFLMLALRTMTFGPEYSFSYRCQSCGSMEKSTIDIVADLDEKAADEDLREPIEVRLKDANCTVAGRFLRISDQDLITKYVKRMKMTTIDRDDPSYQYRLALALVSRDGEPFSDLLKKQDFIKALTAVDCLRFEQELQKREPGVDIRVYPDCGACGATNGMALPFDAEFFRPTSV